MRVRNAPLFAILAAIAIGEMFPFIRWVRWLSERGSEVIRLQPVPISDSNNNVKRFLILVSLVLVLTGFAFERADLRIPVLGKGWAKLDPTHWPVEVLSQLNHIQEASPEGTPIFNDYLLGGFLIYYTPKFRVFIDDRCELYGDDFLRKYLNAENKFPALLDQWADHYQFYYAFTLKSSGFDNYLSKSQGWTLLSGSKTASLYSRGTK
jgi:hypothetical protein